jgi:hypothetical protein
MALSFGRPRLFNQMMQAPTRYGRPLQRIMHRLRNRL